MPNRVAELRRSRGMTQAELARRLDISRTYLSRIENGLHKVGGWLMLEIADIFGVPAEEIFYTEHHERKLQFV